MVAIDLLIGIHTRVPFIAKPARLRLLLQLHSRSHQQLHSSVTQRKKKGFRWEGEALKPCGFALLAGQLQPAYRAGPRVRHTKAAVSA